MRNRAEGIFDANEHWRQVHAHFYVGLYQQLKAPLGFPPEPLWYTGLALAPGRSGLVGFANGLWWRLAQMLINETLARELEETAVLLARGAGEILSAYFGVQILVEYKDEHQRDPVTEVDKKAQEYLVKEITERFPDHGILGEEDADDSESPAPDFLWVLDPLDGTTNFLNGLPVYACSVGLLYRGRPLVGALYLPWPKPAGGFILHCRQGGGCWADGEPVSVYKSEEPVNNRLAGLPGGLSQSMSFGRQLGGKVGEVRTTGSIAYELAMTACGVMQYSIFGAPHLWDMAAGALAVQEAGGTVMTRFSREKRWHPLDSVIPTWETRPPTFKELRRWMAPLVAGNQVVAPLVAHSMRRRFRLSAYVKRLSRRLRPKGKPKDSPKTGE